MGRYATPEKERTNHGWMGVLTKRDLEVCATLFGFYDVKEFAAFIAEQHAKVDQ